jgi:two-component system nitrate/nitrite response regulator NarL
MVTDADFRAIGGDGGSSGADDDMATADARSYATVLVGEGVLLLDGLAHILRETKFRVVARAASVDRLAPVDVQNHKDILLLLEAGPDVGTTIRQVESFKQLHAAPRIAAITSALSSADIILLFHAGVHACFVADTSMVTFLKSLELVMLGQALVPRAVLFSLRESEAAHPERPPSGNVALPTNRKPHPLSPLEGHILRDLAKGHSNKSIARNLGTSESTVKVRLKSILRKIGATNRTQAAVWVLNHGLLQTSKEEGAPAPEGSATSPPANSPKDGVVVPTGLSTQAKGAGPLDAGVVPGASVEGIGLQDTHATVPVANGSVVPAPVQTPFPRLLSHGVAPYE